MASYKSGASKVVLPRYANHSSLNVDYFNTPTERLGELRTDPEYYNYSTEYFRSRYSFSSDPADDYTQYGGQQIGALLGQHSDPSGYPRLAVRDDDIYLPGREYHYMKPVPQQYPVAEISQVSPVPQYPYYPSYVQPPKVQYYWNPAYTVLPVGYHGGPVVTSQPYGFRPPSYGRGRAADDSSTCADSDASTIYRKERAGAWLSRGCCWWLFFIFVFLVGAAALGGIGYGIYLAVQSPKVREYEYSGVAILPGVPYKDEYKFLRDPVTRQFSDNFCKKILSTMQKSSLRDSYRGCEVTLLERGSTKVHFTLNFTRQPAGDGGCEVVIQEDSCDRSQDIRDMLYNEAQGGTAFKEYGSGVISWSIQPKILVGKSTTADPSILMSSMASRSSTNAKMTTAERVKQTTIAPEVTNPITAVPAQSTEVIVTTGIVETGTEKLNTESELQTTDAGQSTAGPPNTSGSALTAVYLTTETSVSGSAAFTPGSTIEDTTDQSGIISSTLKLSTEQTLPPELATTSEGTQNIITGAISKQTGTDGDTTTVGLVSDTTASELSETTGLEATMTVGMQSSATDSSFSAATSVDGSVTDVDMHTTAMEASVTEMSNTGGTSTDGAEIVAGTESTGTDTPTDVTDTPTDVTDTQIDVTDSPTDVTDSPTDITDTQTDVTDSPTDVTDTQTDVTDSPLDVTDTPTDVTDTQIDVTDTPTDITDTQTDVTDSPTDVTDTQTDVTDSPTDNTDTQTNVTDSPLDVTSDKVTDVTKTSAYITDMLTDVSNVPTDITGTLTDTVTDVTVVTDISTADVVTNNSQIVETSTGTEEMLGLDTKTTAVNTEFTASEASKVTDKTIEITSEALEDTTRDTATSVTEMPNISDQTITSSGAEITSGQSVVSFDSSGIATGVTISNPDILTTPVNTGPVSEMMSSQSPITGEIAEVTTESVITGVTADYTGVSGELENGTSITVGTELTTETTDVTSGITQLSSANISDSTTDGNDVTTNLQSTSVSEYSFSITSFPAGMTEAVTEGG